MAVSRAGADGRCFPSEPVKKTRPCVVDFLDVSRACLKPRERPGLNVTLRMIDAAVEFICHNNGDRLACKKDIACGTGERGRQICSA